MVVSDCINPFLVLAAGLIGFLAWINIVRISLSVFPKIRDQEPELYNRILSRNDAAWLERGWYSPADIGVQFRLYRSIYYGDANQLLSHSSWRGYVWSARICIAAFIMALIGAIAVFVCYA